MQRGRRTLLRGVPALLTAALLTSTTLGSSPARAAGPALSEPVRQTIGNARLAGSGTYRWFGLKIYDAALWIGADFDAAAPYSTPFALQLTYARDLVGKRIASASRDEIVKLGIGTSAQQDTWLQRMDQLFPDVKDGTRLTGLYLPGKGVRFYRDGRVLGAIDDDAFARAFFAIWLDPRTSAPDLRRALLGDAARAASATAATAATAPTAR